MGVIHRDIKPQNILIKEGQCMLADFGVSKLVTKPEDWMLTQTEGTFHFMPPEACDPDVDQIEGRKADVWALGVTLFCLSFNAVPFDGANEFWVMESIRKNPLTLPETRQISDELRALIKFVLDKDPKMRPTAAQILEHPFLSEP